MPKITDNTGKVTSEAAAIMNYFGKKPGQTLSEFMTEVRALTPADKTELAIGACKELGWTVSES